jgi:hypothetical protein
MLLKEHAAVAVAGIRHPSKTINHLFRLRGILI